MTYVRESIFSSGYMKIIPALTTMAQDYTDNTLAGRAVPTVMGGTVLSLLSHPAESIRFRQQNNNTSITQVISAMSQNNKGVVKNLWADAVPRLMRYSFALLIMSEARAWLTKQMYDIQK